MKSPPRIEIAQIVADGRPGGGTTMLLGMIDDLAQDPALRFTIVSQPGSYLEGEIRRRGLPFVGLDFFRFGPNPALPWLLARSLGPARFTLTHLHGLRAAHHAVRWPARARLGRLVYTVHGLHQLHLGPLVRWAANRADRQVMRRVDQVVFVSQADLAQARHWNLLPGGPSRAATVVWNGIDMGAVRARAAADKDIDVAFVGRLVDQKQPLLAARVLAALAASGRRCVLAGGGPLAQPCRDLLRGIPGGEAVQMQGELSHEAALQLLGRTRVVLMPSAWEGLPILPMEAMAAGATLVATRLPGIAEVVADGITGLLIPAGNARAMQEAAESILGNPAREGDMTRAAAQRVRDLFDRLGTSERYRDIYRGVLAGGPPTGREAQAQNAR